MPLICGILEQGEDKQGALFPVLPLMHVPPIGICSSLAAWNRRLLSFTLVPTGVCHPSKPEVVESTPAFLVPVYHASFL